MSFQISDSEMAMFDAATEDLRIAFDKLYEYRQADEQRFFCEFDRFMVSANQFMTTATHIQARRFIGNGSFAVLGYDIRRPETLKRAASSERQSLLSHLKIAFRKISGQ